MRRVIYALPFTSVTEQNAQVFRAAFRDTGERSVLEHHSAYQSQSEGVGEEDHPTEVRRRLTVENWDAPVVVTTNVQLLESLFAARTSDCRKLHRIAKSVIVLDEAQTLPANMLKPTLAALQELSSSYGCSIVLCSATMPAVSGRAEFEIGLRGVREIVSDPGRLERAMRRVRVQRIGTLADDEIVGRINSLDRALVIVNTRPHAARLFRAVRDRGIPALHLSGLMCPEHRSWVVGEMKARLSRGEPCVVISTQVIEAGVDIDFPVVFRAMAGLDSIIQAAGRCNREGRLESATVHVFDTDEQPPGEIGRGASITARVLEAGVDPLELATVEKYFRLLYWDRKAEWDGGIGLDGRSVGITDDLLSSRKQAYREAAQAYKIIDEDSRSTPVVIPFGERGKAICDALIRGDNAGLGQLRAAQRFSVNARTWLVDKSLETGVCVRSDMGPVILTSIERYDSDVGLTLDEQPPDPSGLTI